MNFVFNYSGTMDNAAKLIDAANDVPDEVKSVVKDRMALKGPDFVHSISVRGAEIGDIYSFSISISSSVAQVRQAPPAPVHVDDPNASGPPQAGKQGPKR